MTWSKDKLRAVAAERGETAADSDALGRLLLAHERLRGRTEEDYPRDEAGKELDALLERQASPLPQDAAREYAGLKQLRAYVADRALQPAVSQSAVKEKAEPAPVDQRREPERERGSGM